MTPGIWIAMIIWLSSVIRNLSKWITIEISPGVFQKSENSKVALNGGHSIVFTRN